jgi:hypothetical protein
MSFPLNRKGLLAAVASSALLVAGCATETTYHPATGQGFNRTGFSDHQIEPDRFSVTFAGNEVTSRETVEKYLLFRAAQLTLEHGYDYFVMANRDTDRQQQVYSTPGFGAGFGPGFRGYGFGGLWGPSWRYYGRGFGWRSWDPFFGGPFWGDSVDIRSVDRFEATAEIVMRRGPIPQDNLRAFDAHRVVDSIGPTVVLPKQR